jgi:hypothetical protein
MDAAGSLAVRVDVRMIHLGSEFELFERRDGELAFLPYGIL